MILGGNLKKQAVYRLVLLLALLFLPQWALADSELPLLGENAAFNLQQEDALGSGLYHALKQQGYIVDDPLLSRYLQDIGESLLSTLDVRFRKYHFFLVKDTAVNAFAAPGGYIGVNIGLIAIAKNVDELASVMAHEIAHVRLKHSMQMIERAQKVNIASMISVLAAILISGQDAEVANAILFTGIAGGTQSMINYTRENEYEADREGIELLKKSDYNPRAAADFMRVLQSREQRGELASIEYLRTHPVSENRIAEISSRLQGIAEKASSPLYFQQYKDYLFYLYPQNSVHRTSRFAQALEQMRNGAYRKSEAVLRELLKYDPDSLWLNYALAQNLEFQQKIEQAKSVYRSTLLLYPDDLALNLKMGRLLLQQRRPRQALQLAQSVFRLYREDPAVYQLQVEIHSQLDDELSRQLAEANYHWYSGNREVAKQQFEALLRNETLDAASAAEIRQKIDSL